jgi:hypothetical protein
MLSEVCFKIDLLPSVEIIETISAFPTTEWHYRAILSSKILQLLELFILGRYVMYPCNTRWCMERTLLQDKLIIWCVDRYFVRHDILGVRWILKTCSALNMIDVNYLTTFNVT